MELYDPFGFWGGQQDQPQQQPFQVVPGQRAVPLLQPEEEDSLLSKVTGNVLGGLGYVGGTLGKLFGGRAIRGALGGNARELLSVIPGSDTFGITDPTQEVHGEKLLKDWGLLQGEGQKGTFELRDLAGPALEAALDPGTYLTLGGGALTGAGKAAKAGGTLEKTLAGRIAAGQSGLAGLHVPFTDLGVTLGTGSTAERVAQGLGSANDWLNYGNPVGRNFGALFDAGRSLGGKPAMTGPVQKGIKAINEAIPEAKATAGKRVLDVAEQLQDLGGMTPTNAEVRNYLEGTVPSSGIQPSQQAAADSLRQVIDQPYKDALQLGRDIGHQEGYFPRQLTPAGDEEVLNRLSRGKLADTFNTHQLHREEIFDLPGRTDFINQMSVDPNVSGPARTINSASGLAEADYVRSQIPSFNAQELNTLRQMDPATLASSGQAGRLAELEDIQKKTEGLADWLSKLSPKRAAEKLPVFGNNALSDAYQYVRSQAESNVKTKGLLKIIGDAAGPVRGPGTVPVTEVLQKIGLTEQSRVALADMLGKPSTDILGLHLDSKIADDLVRVKAGFTEPEALKPVLGAIDSFTNLFKVGATAVWPSRYIRNFTQEVWNMFVGGHADPRFAGPQAYLTPMTDAVSLLRKGGTLDGAAEMPYFAGRGLTDELASRELRKEMFARGIAGPDKLVRESDVIGQGMHAAQKNLQLPGDIQPTIGQIAKSAVPRSIEEAMPTSIAGFAGRTETKFAPAVAGKRLDTLIDDATRGGSFVALMRQGYTPQAADAATKMVHYDYSALSPFEKSVMRRVMPFYNWCVPDDSEILTRDGWKTCDELVVGEEVLTYNLGKDRLQWQKSLDKNIFEHHGTLLELKNKTHALRFTPGHRWPIRVRGETVKHSYGTYTYPERHDVVTGEDLRSNHALIVSAEYFGKDSILTPKQARLLGWLMTDGSWRKTSVNYTEAVLYQHPGKFLNEVIAVAGGKPRKPHPISGTVCVPVLKERKEEILPYLDKDKLIKVVTRLSREAAEAMYDAMYKGDGGTKPHREYDFFAATHIGVREAFRVLALMLGKRTSFNKRGASVSPRRYLKVQGCALSPVPYDGRVWCPTTANGTWVMRQNGFITITGNSRQNTPAVLRQIIEEPGGKTALGLKAAAASRHDQGFLPPSVGEGLALPLGQEEDGTQRFLSHTQLPFEDAFAMLGTGPNPVQRTLENLASDTNPLIKGPLELIAGKQLYNGKQLSDLYGSTGNQLVDQAVYNGPGSRFVTSFRTLMDERKDPLTKAVNLLSPARITDTDMDKARSIAGRELVEQMLQGNPNVKQFETISVPSQLLGNLTPEEFKLIQLYKTLEFQKKQPKIGIAR